MKSIIVGFLIALSAASAEAMIQPGVYFYSPADQKVRLGQNDVAQLQFDFTDNTVTFDKNGCGATFFNGASGTSLSAGMCTQVAHKRVVFDVKAVGNFLYVIANNHGIIFNKDNFIFYKGRFMPKEETPRIVGAVYPLPLPDDPSQIKNEKVVSWFELFDASSLTPGVLDNYTLPDSVSIANSKILHVSKGKYDVMPGRLSIDFKHSTITFFDSSFRPSLVNGRIVERLGCGTVLSIPVMIRKVGKLIYVMPKEPLKTFITPLPVPVKRSVGFILDNYALGGVVYPLPFPSNPWHLKSSLIIDWFQLH